MATGEPAKADHIPSRRPEIRTDAGDGKFTRSGAVPKKAGERLSIAAMSSSMPDHGRACNERVKAR
jgi:hypothetical protein